MLECINDNTYRVDLPSEYEVGATFNVTNFSPFDNVGSDLMTNTFEEEGSLRQPWMW